MDASWQLGISVLVQKSLRLLAKSRCNPHLPEETSQRRTRVDREREREREVLLTIKREREIYEERYSIMAGSRASPGVHTTRGISIAMLAWQGLSLTAIYPLGSERCDKSRLGEWNRTRCYGHTSHKSEGREARGGTGAIASAGNMSNGTCMRERRRARLSHHVRCT